MIRVERYHRNCNGDMIPPLPCMCVDIQIQSQMDAAWASVGVLSGGLLGALSCDPRVWPAGLSYGIAPCSRQTSNTTQRVPCDTAVAAAPSSAPGAKR